jgi:hypothetical protein
VSGEDVEGLTVTTRKCGSMHGRFVFDTGAPPDDARPLVRWTGDALRDDPGAGRMTTNADWTFAVQGLMGLRVFRLEGPTSQFVGAPGWYLKAVMLNGSDIIDTPLDFSDGREVRDLQAILTRQRTEVSGTAVDGRNVPVDDYFVLLFPEDRNRRTRESRFIAAGRSNPGGRFTITGLPPGNYLAAAVSELEPTEERDPELLERLERAATRVILGEGESKALTLRVVAY